MKNTLVVLIAAAVIAVGGIGYLVLAKKDNVPKNTSSSAGSTTAIPTVASFKKACDVLSEADVQVVLGSGTSKNVSSGSADVVTSERSVTTCSYKNGDGSALKQAIVLLRASAASEAKAGFNGAKQSDATSVAGLGEAAYWSPTYSQLNVLKGNTWMIISVGGPGVSDHSEAESKTLAERLISKL